jgi:hypothetical protein
MRSSVAVSDLSKLIATSTLALVVNAGCGGSNPTAPTPTLNESSMPGPTSSTSNITVYTAPTSDELMSFVPRTGELAGNTIRYFGQKAGDGTPLKLSEVLIVPPGRSDAQLHLVLDDAARPVSVADTTGANLKLDWVSDTNVRFTVRTPTEREGLSGEIPTFWTERLSSAGSMARLSRGGL